ncbi:14925_t:CDS:2 [Funneliformis caledonium]|uniref:14925_t:CDS:1 n=1 Tax=Funneliformis caledonium TaxID=1117310 RepID=A0A9N9CLV4_9GLOM|nr:14925_t:CDS:2 [Funneliformis caledonium]
MSFENIDGNEGYNSSDDEDLDAEFELEDGYFDKEGKFISNFS